MLRAVSDLTSTTGIVALAAAALAAIALIAAAVLYAKLRKLGAAHTVVLGRSGSRDLVEQAGDLEERIEQPIERVVLGAEC